MQKHPGGRRAVFAERPRCAEFCSWSHCSPAALRTEEVGPASSLYIHKQEGGISATLLHQGAAGGTLATGSSGPAAARRTPDVSARYGRAARRGCVPRGCLMYFITEIFSAAIH